MKTKTVFLTALVVSLSAFALSAARAGSNLVVDILVHFPKLEMNSLVLPLEPVLKNPTGGALRITFPFVSVSVGDSLLGTTDPVDLDVHLKPRSSVNLRKHLKDATGQDFDLRLSYLAIANSVPGFVGLLAGKSPGLNLSVTTSTTAYAPGLPIGGMPISVTETVPIKGRG